MPLSEKARIDARRRAESDLWFLATEILEWGDKGFLEADFHKPLCRWIEASDVPCGSIVKPVNKTRMLLWPRFHGKTTLFTVADNIRLQLRHPGLCIAIGHDGKDDAIQIMSQIRKEFEEKKLLKEIAQDVCFQTPERESPQWNADAFMLKRKAYYRVPSFMAVSPDAMPTGFHFDVWTWDDLVTEKNSKTEFQRVRCRNAIGYVKPYMPPHRMGYRKIAGTRWHLADAYGSMEKLIRDGKIKGDMMVGGMLNPETGEPWMRTRYCVEKTGPEDERETLAQLREEMGSFTFAACMQNDPLPEGTAAFHVDDVIRFDLLGTEKAEWRSPIEGRTWQFFTAVDLNTQATTAGDYAVVMTVAKSDQGHLVVVDVSRGHPTRWQLVEWVERHNRTWRPRTVFVETVAYQKTFVADLADARHRSGEWMPVEQVTRGGAKNLGSKNDRIMSLQGPIEARKLWVPKGERFDFLIEEIAAFAPEFDSAHDDGLDCLADIHRIGGKPAGLPPVEPSRSPEQLLTAYFLAAAPADTLSEDGSEVIVS